MDLPITRKPRETTFTLVSRMNTAFGNPKGDPTNIDWPRIRSQCKNIFDEYLELLHALGMPASSLYMQALRDSHNKLLAVGYCLDVDVKEVRDALCDINVFSTGAQHLMGIDGDADMEAVINGVMTRFVKDEADMKATIAMHAAKGVTDVYHEGTYPTAILKSAKDQPDAPTGKFLKSASYQQTVFPPLF